ncbi:MAG: hypothetical protein KF897_02745 [Opitutaceae bacterium]|nr:hypothetical protein [Candidatus Didemnitutus sp.]MBX3748986.1 hypothetical protein [Opitutaceae bacterium]
MLTKETLLAQGFRTTDEALSTLGKAMQHWKHIRGTLRRDGADLLCSAPPHGRSGPFRYPAQVLLRADQDSRISVWLSLEYLSKRESIWLLASFLFFPALCAYPDGRHLGLGVGLGAFSGFARAAFLFLGARRVESDFVRLYRPNRDPAQATTRNTNAA